ncbi:MAG: hypothetical protein IJ418_12355 [Clostridia bacterium]|nr:hypothetical protein [Clostridia bacterium]
MEQKYIEYELVPGTKIVVKVDVGSCIDDMELAELEDLIDEVEEHIDELHG